MASPAVNSSRVDPCAKVAKDALIGRGASSVPTSRSAEELTWSGKSAC